MDASPGDAANDNVNPRPVDAPADIPNGGSGSIGLVGYWKLDEGTTSIADSSGNGNSGTLFNNPTWTAGPPLKFANTNALVLNGTSQYASLGNPAVLNFTGQITMAAWVKVASNAGAHNVLAHGYQGASEVFLRVASGVYGVGSLLNSSGAGANANIPAGDTGAWVHLAGVHDGTAWRLYRNGVQVASSAGTMGAVPVAADWAIGARGDGTSRWFSGAVDDVRIYKRALSAAEIADLHSGAP